MSNITEHDFGKRSRDAARAFARLSGILETRAEEFLKDPEAFFKEAGDKIVRLRLVIEKAYDAQRSRLSTAFPDTSAPIQHVQDVRIPAEEYARLKECARIIREAHFDGQ